jgi:tetratricopeptide (TPR) repeat protein
LAKKHKTAPPISWWPYAAAVAAITFVAFIPALHGQFQSWDDWPNFVQNQRYRGLGGDQLHWMWTTTHLGHYTPLAWMTLGLDYTFWGMNPVGYHLVSLLLHCAAAVLLFLIAWRVIEAARVADTRDTTAVLIGAGFAALFFAVHPLRVESVAWITERRDVLSLTFYLAAILSYLRAIGGSGRFRKWYGATVALFVCAILSKGTAVTLPAALFVLNVYPLRRLGCAVGWTTSSARRVYVELAPLAMLSAAAGLLSVKALPLVTPLSPIQKVEASLYGLGFYLWKTILPLGLSPLYEMPVHFDGLRASFLMMYSIATLFLVLAIGSRRRWPGVAAGILGFVLLSLPLLGVVQNGPQIAADRYTYQSGIALALVAGGLVASPHLRRFRVAVVVGVIGVFSLLTWRQSLVWKDSASMWTRVVEMDSTSSYAYNNLGALLADQGKRSDALRFYARAVELRPNFPAAHNNWGFDLAAAGDTIAAIAQYQTALTQKSDFAEADVNLGNIFASRRQFPEAIARYAHALSVDPSLAGAQLNWGIALEQQGKIADALPHFQAAVALDPNDQDAAAALARARQTR